MADTDGETNKSRIRALRPLIPLVVTLIYQTVDWWLIENAKNSWYEGALQSIEVYVGVIISFIWYLSELIYHVRHLNALKELPKFEKKLKVLEDSAIKTIQTATEFIERAFNLQVMTELRENYHLPLLDALRGLGYNLRNWENLITKEERGRRYLLDDPVRISVWLRYMRTYYFEEAFDIRHKEIITNGRNFCFILIATLQAYLENLNENEEVHYYSVTPVHPEDWYNWPHGHQRPKAHFESEFIGLFHRILREILNTHKYRGEIVHSRFIISSLDKDEKPFGWPILEYDSAKRRLENAWLLPLAVPIDELKNAKCDILKAFYSYYSVLGLGFQKDINNRLAIPLFCTEWDKNLLIKWLENERSKAPSRYLNWYSENLKKLENAFNVLQSPSARKNANSTELLQISLNYHSRNLKKYLLGVTPPKGCNSCANAYSKVSFLVEKIFNDEQINIQDFVQNVHCYTVCLSEHDEPQKQKNLNSLLNHALRLKDCSYVNLHPWPKLSEVFTQSLHSNPENCYLKGLNKEQLKKWSEDNINPEFAFFGLKNNKQEKPIWKLIITTDLDYPFDVTKIKFIEPGDLMWRMYENTINNLQDINYYKSYEIYKGKEV